MIHRINKAVRRLIGRPKLNRNLLDLCLTMFIENPSIWDVRGYVKETPTGMKYCLSGLAMALSGKTMKRDKFWFSTGDHGNFHDDARAELGLTALQAEDLFAAYHLSKTPEQYKEFVYGRLGLKTPHQP